MQDKGEVMTQALIDEPTEVEAEVKKALRKLLLNKNQKVLNYAISYAELGCYMTGDSLRVQVLYVLNNMQYWRGDTAKEVRVTLKAFINR